MPKKTSYGRRKTDLQPPSKWELIEKIVGLAGMVTSVVILLAFGHSDLETFASILLIIGAAMFSRKAAIDMVKARYGAGQ